MHEGWDKRCWTTATTSLTTPVSTSRLRPNPTVRMTESGENYGLFVIEPLPRGFGVTLGNPCGVCC